MSRCQTPSPAAQPKARPTDCLAAAPREARTGTSGPIGRGVVPPPFVAVPDHHHHDGLLAASASASPAPVPGGGTCCASSHAAPQARSPAMTSTSTRITKTPPAAADDEAHARARAARRDARDRVPPGHSDSARASSEAPVQLQDPAARDAATAPSQAVASSAMIFSDLYKKPRSPLAKLCHHHPQVPAQPPTATPDWLGAEYADLLGKDKTKQKEAVKRYLSHKVRADWEFPWPQRNSETPAHGRASQTVAIPGCQNEDGAHSPAQQVQDETRDDDGYQVDEDSALEEPPPDAQVGDQDDDAQSIYSIVSEDGLHYRPQLEWTSDLSDQEAPLSPHSARLNSMDAARLNIKVAAMEKQDCRRRALRDEMAWNNGLACFEARRKAWTGAKTVRVRSKPASPPSPASPRSPRRFFFRHSMSGSPPSVMPSATGQSADGSSTVSDASSSLAREKDNDMGKQPTPMSPVPHSTSPQLWPVETLVPVAQPLLPPNTPLRMSITPSVYVSLYDKVILNNLQPACPVNLSDMLRSCVAGWKRDGEWPPRPSAVDPSMASRKKKKKATAAGNEHGSNVARRMSFGLLGREKDDDSRSGKGIRRSLQRALGIGIVSGGPDGIEDEKARGA